MNFFRNIPENSGIMTEVPGYLLCNFTVIDNLSSQFLKYSVFPQIPVPQIKKYKKPENICISFFKKKFKYMQMALSNNKGKY